MKKNSNTNLSGRPVNPKTGKFYGAKTKKYNEWFNKLSENDKNIVCDLSLLNIRIWL